MYQTVFSQRDARWADEKLGTSYGGTIGQYGCYLTTFADMARLCGKMVDPSTLNQSFIQHGLYSNGNLMIDTGLQGLYDDLVYVETIDYISAPADLGRLRDLLAEPGTMVLVRLDFDHDPHDGIQDHFSPVDSCDGQSLALADPWYGRIDDWTIHYGDQPARDILKFVVYRGPIATQPIPQPAGDDLPPPPWDGLWLDLVRQVTDLHTEVGGVRGDLDTCQKAMQTLQADRDTNFNLKMAFEAQLRALEGQTPLPAGTVDQIIKNILNAGGGNG